MPCLGRFACDEPIAVGEGQGTAFTVDFVSDTELAILIIEASPRSFAFDQNSLALGFIECVKGVYVKNVGGSGFLPFFCGII